MMVEIDRHDIFISFSSRDLEEASAIREKLEKNNMRCWISSRDVGPGENYQAAIVKAIQNAKILVLVFSENTNKSGEVLKELSLASAFKLSVIPARIVDVRPDGAFLYELATRQWIDCFGDWHAAMERLVATTLVILGRGGGDASPAGDPAATPSAALVAPEPSAPHVVSAMVFSKEQLDHARFALAHHVGPIADLLVRKASKRSASLSELHDHLAAHVTAPVDQEKFRTRLKQNIASAFRSPHKG